MSSSSNQTGVQVSESSIQLNLSGINVLFNQEKELSPEEYISIMNRSGLGERRPIDDQSRIKRIVENSNLIVTARTQDNTIVGIARGFTDFAFNCYLADLAVDKQYQRKGIGKNLINIVRNIIGKDTRLLSLSSPQAMDYFATVGFKYLDNAWTQTPE